MLIPRRKAAACLFEILVLATEDAIQIQQEAPYDDIIITATENFPAAAAEE